MNRTGIAGGSYEASRMCRPCGLICCAYSKSTVNSNQINAYFQNFLLTICRAYFADFGFGGNFFNGVYNSIAVDYIGFYSVCSEAGIAILY
jgi:hypothetical protein